LRPWALQQRPPVPDRAIAAGWVAAFVAIVSVAVLAPCAFGANRTSIALLAPAATGAVHPLVTM
jgi:hypothetical protein